MNVPPSSKVGAKQKRPKTGGRAKGTPNKATANKAAAIAQSGKTPLDYMLGVMRNAKQPDDIRLDAAKSAAPYVHPKLAAVEMTGQGGSPLLPNVPVDAIEVAKRVAFLLASGVHAQK